MSYNYSKIDEKLAAWFMNDNSSTLLRSISLRQGQVRSLKKFSLQIDFPITVIAGRNGSGKTTLLALAACAFHNSMEKPFKLTSRKIPYYTFSDFLIQSSEEVSPEGIEIYYGIAYNHWKLTANNTMKEGVGIQSISKVKGGKWKSYGGRVSRTVVFFGIDRVVPHSEKSVSKSYRASFISHSKNGCEEMVKDSVSKVLGISYEDFHFKSHTKYRLPFVKRGALSYSGFNMGAGENALFEIFYNLYACPEGTLAIIDEVELGLHQQAQKKLIQELKKVCLNRKLQIVCTTHSSTILSEIPPVGRFYIESFQEKTIMIPQISADFAAGKLAGEHSEELVIYVEDGVAKDILESLLDTELRNRILISKIGSDSSVITLMAGMRKANHNINIMGVLDGDKRSELSKKHTQFLKKLESYESVEQETFWIINRLDVLPGNAWPEKWCLNVLKNTLSDDFLKGIKSTKYQMLEYIEQAEIAGKHNEFYELSKILNMDIGYLRKMIANHVTLNSLSEFSSIMQKISELLKV